VHSGVAPRDSVHPSTCLVIPLWARDKISARRLSGERVNFYLVSGLSVSSEIALPGLAAATPTARADVTIRRTSVPPILEFATAIGPNWQIAGDRFLLRIPDIARILLTGGREIAFQAENGTLIEDVAIFLMGTAFGILLLQRQRIVLHASGIEVQGRAVLFCGPSGAGKSTLAAALTRRRYRLLADDLCSVELGQPPLAHSDGRQLKLWGQSINGLGLAARRGAPVRRGVDKYYVEPVGATPEALPIGAIYVLRQARATDAPGIVRRNVAEAALLLCRNAYRPLLVTRMHLRANYLEAAGRISSTAGVFHLTRNFEFEALSDIISRLESHWVQIGLAGRTA
jgi:hypothetical protein